jgi:hypothetical protein
VHFEEAFAPYHRGSLITTIVNRLLPLLPLLPHSPDPLWGPVSSLFIMIKTVVVFSRVRGLISLIISVEPLPYTVGRGLGASSPQWERWEKWERMVYNSSL